MLNILQDYWMNDLQVQFISHKKVDYIPLKSVFTFNGHAGN